MKKRMLYLSHPSGGLKENELDTQECVRLILKNDDIFNNFCLISPVNSFSFMYNDKDIGYDRGLAFCTDLLRHCDIMIVVGDYTASKGCIEEIRICKELNIPYIEFKSYGDLKEAVDKGLCNIMLSMNRGGK